MGCEIRGFDWDMNNKFLTAEMSRYSPLLGYPQHSSHLEKSFLAALWEQSVEKNWKLIEETFTDKPIIRLHPSFGPASDRISFFAVVVIA